MQFSDENFAVFWVSAVENIKYQYLKSRLSIDREKVLCMHIDLIEFP